MIRVRYTWLPSSQEKLNISKKLQENTGQNWNILKHKNSVFFLPSGCPWNLKAFVKRGNISLNSNFWKFLAVAWNCFKSLFFQTWLWKNASKILFFNLGFFFSWNYFGTLDILLSCIKVCMSTWIIDGFMIITRFYLITISFWKDKIIQVNILALFITWF